MLIAAFLLCLLLPLVLFGRAPWDPEVERRPQAPPPALMHAGWATWPARIEAWAGDRFGLRATFLGARLALQHALFHASAAGDVAFGRGDWLFYLISPVRDELAGRYRRPDADRAAWTRALEDRRKAAAAAGASYFFLIAPNKETIYPEFLRPGMAGTGARERDRLTAAIRPSVDAVIDPTEALLAAKPALQLYHQIDVHWNDAGAYTAYRALSAAIAERLRDFRPIALKPQQFTRVMTDSGDLAAMALHRPRWPHPVPTVAYAGPALPCQTPRPKAPVDWPVPRSVFPETVFECPSGHGRALVFGDSMSHALLPYLAASFAHLRVVPQYPDAAMIAAYAAGEHPDLVIEEQVERQLLFRPVVGVTVAVAGAHETPPQAAGGWLSVQRAADGMVLAEGWAFGQEQVPGRVLRLRAEATPADIAAGGILRGDVVADQHDGRLRQSGFVLRFRVPGATTPRFCLWSEDPVYGARRIRFADHAALNLCP